jgi:Glyoxalase-like domain
VPFTIDHVFVMCAAGAPEAALLTRAGLTEGSSNTHPGQGTASRRFFFQNAYLELPWVADAEEARREPAARTRLWERWSRRGREACPFGLIFSSTDSSGLEPPFPTWSYHPPYSPVAIDVGLATPLSEPELFYFRFARPPGATSEQPRAHPLGVHKLTAVSVGLRGGTALSDAAQAVEATGLVTFFASDDYVMRLGFDGAAGEATVRQADLRPDLPIVLGF